MKERPILFSAPMVRAILEGQKTQTRRVVKPQPDITNDGEPYWNIGGYRAYQHRGITDPLRIGTHNPLSCKYGEVGSRLWVRETWRIGAWREDGRFAIDYAASPEITNTPWVTIPNDYCGELSEAYWYGVCSELHNKGVMPNPSDGRYHWDAGKAPLRWRPSIHMPRWVSRITLEIVSVRVERLNEISNEDIRAEGACTRASVTHRLDFQDLWESINGPGSWAENPFVWVIEFKRV